MLIRYSGAGWLYIALSERRAELGLLGSSFDAVPEVLSLRWVRGPLMETAILRVLFCSSMLRRRPVIDILNRCGGVAEK